MPNIATQKFTLGRERSETGDINAQPIELSDDVAPLLIFNV
jgi:hypothetical protein